LVNPFAMDSTFDWTVLISLSMVWFLSSSDWTFSASKLIFSFKPTDSIRSACDFGAGWFNFNKSAKPENYLYHKNHFEVLCVSPMVIWPEFRMGKWRDDDHKEDAHHFEYDQKNSKDSGYQLTWNGNQANKTVISWSFIWANINFIFYFVCFETHQSYWSFIAI